MFSEIKHPSVGGLFKVRGQYLRVFARMGDRMHPLFYVHEFCRGKTIISIGILWRMRAMAS